MPDNPVEAYYDATTEHYRQQYERENLYNLKAPYPSNYFRLQMLVNSFTSKGIKRVVEVGVGEGTPLVNLGKIGFDIWGFDISHEMVKSAKQRMKENGFDPDHIAWADIQDSLTYAHVLKNGQFDGLMAMGVMPHVENDDLTLTNMSTLIRPGGSVFIEFRNKLLSLFSFNRYTADFILNDLLEGVDDKVKEKVRKDLESRLQMDMPPVRKNLKDSQVPGFDAILSKFHNPFEVVEMFERHNFKDIHLLWYHYHPAMPYLEKEMPELFRKEAVRLEHETSNWRGYFLCSAFVIEATKAQE
jgi:2-polyprenyl-3-methyl-5-hydroxy-6-metoxy-1,4-benzoquinol methylase